MCLYFKCVCVCRDTSSDSGSTVLLENPARNMAMPDLVTYGPGRSPRSALQVMTDQVVVLCYSDDHV